MNPPDANGRPANEGPETSECVRCGMPAATGAAQCAGCLLRLALEFNEADPELADGPFEEFESTADESSQARRIGNYEVIDEIGRGGMGIIFSARHLGSGHVVALKCLLDYHADSAETVARFRREAASAAMLEHPNILPVYEVDDTDDGLPFFSMQLARGGTLHRNDGRARRDPRASALLMHKVAAAVHYAHERGILHRDLKPGNILLDEEGEPFVSDFGLAKWLHEPDGLTRTLLVFGTPGYIAPEQAHGPANNVGPAADVYSLGAILFELLTGRPPFLGEHALAVLKQAAEKQAPELRTLAPELDRALETICARCLEREPAARYASAGELADDLARWLNGDRINAKRVGVAAKLWRAARANRVLTGALAAAFLCGVAGAALVVKNRTLKLAADETVLATRSIVVLPVFDLDTATADHQATQRLVETLGAQLRSIGPVRVIADEKGPGPGPGPSVQQRVVDAAARTRSALVVSATKRTIDGESRLSVRTFTGASGEQIKVSAVQSSAGGDALFASWSQEAARELDQMLETVKRAPREEPHPDPGLRDPAVRHSIESGRNLMFRQSEPEMDRAIALFEQALAVEPRSAVARAYLSSALSSKVFFRHDDALLARAESEARQAVELAPAAIDGRRALAGVLYQKGWVRETREELMKTAELCGIDEHLAGFIAMALDHTGETSSALRWYQVALAGTKRPANTLAMIGDCWIRLHDDEKALHAYRRANELQPGLVHAVAGIARVAMLRGDFATARRSIVAQPLTSDFAFSAQLAAQIEFFARDFARAEQLYTELAARDDDGGASFFGAVLYQPAIARCMQERGRGDEATKLLLRSLETQRAVLAQRPTNATAMYAIAATEASLGLKASALQHLRAAFDHGWLDYRSLQLDPRFDALRQEPAFNEVLGRMTATAAEQRAGVASL